MKANELRIGNWVNFGETQVQVDWITEYEPDNILVNKCTPIPLDEDWLMRFGFRKNTHGSFVFRYANNRQFTIHRFHGGFSFHSSNKGYDITTVHQAQNIFHALIGEELTLSQTL